MEEKNKIQKKEIFFLFVLAVFLLFISFDFFSFQLNGIEKKIFQIAKDINNGKIPYKDINDNTPPLNYYIYLTAQKLFNLYPEDGNLRIFVLIYIIFFLLLLYIISRLMTGATVAMMSSFFYVIFTYKSIYSGIYALPGLFSQFPLFLSLMFLIFIEKGYEKVDYFLSGFFLCVSSYIVFPLKLAVFIPVIYIYMRWKKQELKLKYIMWFFLGFFLMEAVSFLWVIKNSVLKEFINFYFIYNSMSFFNEANIIKDIKEVIPYKYYLIIIFIFLYYVFKFVLNKKYDFNWLLLVVPVFICVVAFFQKKMDIGFFYILAPFFSIMVSVFIKDLMMLILRKYKKY